MSIKFKNDSDRLKSEYNTLEKKNQGLFNVLQQISIHCEQKYKKDIVITQIYRTSEEQDELYKDDPKYKIKKFTSPHQWWSAFDLRSSTFTEDEIEETVDWINSTFNSTNFYKFTAMYHQILGNVLHYHIQWVKK